MILLGLLTGCLGDSSSPETTFAECDGDAIRWLAAKESVQLVFLACGSNRFEDQAWSTDGRHLYFALPTAAHVMDAGAADKASAPVPTIDPEGGAAWLDPARVAIAGAEGGEETLAVHDIAQRSLVTYDLGGLAGITDVRRSARADQVLFLGTGPDGRTVRRLDLATGAIEVAFPWVQGPVDTFSYTPELDAAVIGQGGTVRLWVAGEPAGAWTPAERGALHPAGRWLVLEHQGPESSIFDDPTWAQLPPEVRAEREAEAKQLEARLPEWYDTTVRPERLSLVDRQTGRRWLAEGFQGRDAEWYPAAGHWLSFVLSGLEGRQVRPNVGLTDTSERLRALGEGRELPGFVRMEPQAP